MIAILLHDLGHGPFSHALEGILTDNVSHEYWSLSLMKMLNEKHSGKLSMAIDMFTNAYKRPFFNQLISSQLDMDRLDYLKRDSFYSGVTEGNISTDRIIAMLMVHQEQLVVEEKGMYSIEKFLLARRLDVLVCLSAQNKLCGRGSAQTDHTSCKRAVAIMSTP